MNPLAYLVAVYVTARVYCHVGDRKGVHVADALLVNWLFCTLAKYVNGWFPPSAAFMAIDTMTAIYLGIVIRGKIAALCATFFLGMIGVNFIYGIGSMTASQNDIGLSVLSWAQIAFLFAGAGRHGIGESIASAIRSLGLSPKLASYIDRFTK